MLVKYFDGEIITQAITPSENNPLAQCCQDTKANVVLKFNNYQITEAAEAIIMLVDSTNKYVNEMSPWSLAKDPEKLEQCGEVLYNVLETMRHVSILIYPFVPNIAQEIWKQLSLEGNVAEYNYSFLKWGGLKQDKIADKTTVKPVFLRLDSELAGESKKK